MIPTTGKERMKINAAVDKSPGEFAVIALGSLRALPSEPRPAGQKRGVSRCAHLVRLAQSKHVAPRFAV